ncbi:hypothetical protein F4677DRAFT_422729 [Hypoxylon crocopeplum]|nr:hypothetical protein F4677DRAFT_422729 [Hypoxylon crocopeplum]
MSTSYRITSQKMETTTLNRAEKLSDSRHSLYEAPNSARAVEGQLASSINQRYEWASETIIPYLLERSKEFQRITELRQMGWNNPEGDAFFQKQRRTADECNDSTAAYFYELMQNIGQELHQATNAFAIQQHHVQGPNIFDMCMAPGGFLAMALINNPGTGALAFSLPVSSGGHKVLLQTPSDVEQRFLDITMLAADMGVKEIPEDHPDADHFLPRQFEPDQLFDLVLCDGQVLRTHARAEYREKREARRLTITQLALGLEHLRSGGTMVVLLHKLEAWDTVNLLWTFHKFSSVRVFKPKMGHAKRSSFYLVATNIQSRHAQAVKAIDNWKKMWRVATFGSDEEYQRTLCDGEISVEELLEDFGPELVELGREIWKVQADALAKAPFIRDRKRVSSSRWRVSTVPR